MIPFSLECLTSLVKSLPQGSDLFIPLVPILSALGWMAYSLFYSEQN
jgi:hypothetical protein